MLHRASVSHQRSILKTKKEMFEEKKKNTVPVYTLNSRCESIYHVCIFDEHQIQPTTSPLSACGHTHLLPPRLKKIPDVLETTRWAETSISLSLHKVGDVLSSVRRSPKFLLSAALSALCRCARKVHRLLFFAAGTQSIHWVVLFDREGDLLGAKSRHTYQSRAVCVLN